MKLLVALLVVSLAVLLQGTKPTQGLHCYSCNPLSTCKRKHTIACTEEQNACVKTYRKIAGYTGIPDFENEYNPTMDVHVLERSCMAMDECMRYKLKKKLATVSCCSSDLCNA
ncbi:uncharacterized protein LOC100492585 [Xenopus tropicalis]|uniref:Uncharacterized protein LOC100492585 n=1 Tax=Xenopus tropicalis TaxID=8364 RepID=A0A8J0QYT6_XENTR|nr:uncharacterized protein LOC100492585 [Xenopus tropicalis]|eukprot:XP_002944496.2 PREDICTED: uncharacterized protein LOC100492585 [Xenopus tropicalis]